MSNMKKFNKLIFESLIDKSSYSFSNDENGNVFCIFSIDNKFIVHAKVFNDILTFILTDKNGESKNLSEKEFSFEYHEEYEEFKDKLKSYNLKEDSANENNKNYSKIEDFNEQLMDVENDDPNVVLNKDLYIDNKIFNFKILNDLMVENYCQCTFEIFDSKKDETLGVKSLLFIKKANSIIIKIILQDKKGQTLQNMNEVDFERYYPNDCKTFKNAVALFQNYLNLQ